MPLWSLSFSYITICFLYLKCYINIIFKYDAYENLFRKINACVKACSFIKNRNKQRLNLYPKCFGSTYIKVIFLKIGTYCVFNVKKINWNTIFKKPNIHILFTLSNIYTKNVFPDNKIIVLNSIIITDPSQVCLNLTSLL